MKVVNIIIFLMISLLNFKNCFAIDKNLVLDFGADPTGITSSHQAFKNAAAFFNSNNNVPNKLYIPFGIYIVGKQLENDPLNPQTLIHSIQSWGLGPFEGEDVFVLNNCSNLEIIGITNGFGTKPVIRFDRAMKFGCFDSLTHLAPANIYDASVIGNGIYTRAHVGIIFIFNGCTNVSVDQIEFDGNCNDFILGGNWPIDNSLENGKRQIENVLYGIHIVNSSNIFLNNIELHHFLNNVYISDNFSIGGYTPLKGIHIEINNSKMRNAIANNLAFSGGDTLICSNSIFELGARDIINYAPGAGVDIEPESSINASSTNAFFSKCIFRHNGGSGVNMGTYSPPVTTSNFYFDSCLFIGSKSYSTLASAKTIRFRDCKIYGKVYMSGAYPIGLPNNHFATNSEEGTWFERCFFYDCYNGYSCYKNNSQDQVPALLLAQNTPYLKILNSTFYSYKSYNAYLNGIFGPTSVFTYILNNNASNYMIVKNNKFNNYSPLNFPLYPHINKPSVFVNSKIDGNEFSSFVGAPYFLPNLNIIGTESNNTYNSLVDSSIVCNRLCSPTVDITLNETNSENEYASEYILNDVNNIIINVNRELVANVFIELLPGFDSDFNNSNNNGSLNVYTSLFSCEMELPKKVQSNQYTIKKSFK